MEIKVNIEYVLSQGIEEQKIATQLENSIKSLGETVDRRDTTNSIHVRYTTWMGFEPPKEVE